MTRFLFFGLLLMTGTACNSTTKEQAKAISRVNYFVRYLSAERQLKAQLEAPADTASGQQIDQALFQGDPMKPLRASGLGTIFQVTARNTPYQGTFRFRHHIGNQFYDYVMTMRPSGSVEMPKVIRKEEDLYFRVESGDLEANESLVVLYTDSRNQLYSVTIKGPVGKETHHLSPAAMQAWPAGEGQIYLVKRKVQEELGPDLQGQATVEYYTPTLDVQVQ